MGAADLFRSTKGITMTNGIGTSPASSIATWPIAALRVYAGVYFLIHGWGKIQRGNFADGMVGFLNNRLEGSFGFYRGFVESVVIPNKGLFGFLVSWGELALGIALILGLATRYAAIAGAVLVANFWFVKGQGFFDGPNHDVVWMMILLAFAFLPAGRVLGLDGKLSARFGFLK